MNDFLPPRNDRRTPSAAPDASIEDPWVTSAFDELHRSETMFDQKRRFQFKISHAVTFFVALLIMPFVLKVLMGL